MSDENRYLSWMRTNFRATTLCEYIWHRLSYFKQRFLQLDSSIATSDVTGANNSHVTWSRVLTVGIATFWFIFVSDLKIDNRTIARVVTASLRSDIATLQKPCGLNDLSYDYENAIEVISNVNPTPPMSSASHFVSLSDLATIFHFHSCRLNNSQKIMWWRKDIKS